MGHWNGLLKILVKKAGVRPVQLDWLASSLGALPGVRNRYHGPGSSGPGGGGKPHAVGEWGPGEIRTLLFSPILAF